MASQESSSRQSERRARKGKAPMEGPSARIPKEEDEDCSSKIEWTEYRVPEAMMASMPLDEVMTLKLTRTLRVREEAEPSRRSPPVPQFSRARPLTPSSSSTSLTEPPRHTFFLIYYTPTISSHVTLSFNFLYIGGCTTQ
nr:hypothetical protein Iba_chr09eCG10960 [Ipomoea batatas]